MLLIFQTALLSVHYQNIKSLVEIRDTAVHFYHDKDLSYLVYVIAVASLKNYQQFVKEWFGKSLLEYNFFILPLAFSYSFKTLSTIDIKSKPEAVSNLVKSITNIK